MYTKFALNMIEFKLWILSKIWLPNVKVKIYEMMNTKFKGNLLKNCEGGK
jgi:hypothetical protein